MSYKWATKEGEVLEVMWMDSVHLIHSVNLLIRKNPQLDTKERVALIFSAKKVGVWMEAKERDLASRWERAMAWTEAPQLIVPQYRESIWELAVMHANRELGLKPGYSAVDLEKLALTQPQAARVLARAMALRMMK